jgi:hypothetical protein
VRLEVRSGSTLIASGVGTIRDNDRPSRITPATQQRVVQAAAFESLATSTTVKRK